MRAVFAQEVDIIQVFQPVGVVQKLGVVAAIAELQEDGENPGNTLYVCRNRGVVHHLAALVLAGRVADLGGAAAHEGDRLMAGFLEPVEHHDLDERTGMKAVGGGVEADIGGLRSFREFCIQPFEVAALVDKAAFG